LLQFWLRTREYEDGISYGALKTRVHRDGRPEKPMGRKPFRNSDAVGDYMLYTLVDEEVQKGLSLRQAYRVVYDVLRRDEHARAYTHLISMSNIRDTYLFIRDHLRK
jgi:hypothetical protein